MVIGSYLYSVISLVILTYEITKAHFIFLKNMALQNWVCDIEFPENWFELGLIENYFVRSTQLWIGLVDDEVAKFKKMFSSSNTNESQLIWSRKHIRAWKHRCWLEKFNRQFSTNVSKFEQMFPTSKPALNLISKFNFI